MAADPEDLLIVALSVTGCPTVGEEGVAVNVVTVGTGAAIGRNVNKVAE